MRKITIILFFFAISVKAEDYRPVPFSDVFDGIFLNSGKTFIYDYGLIAAVMAAGTYALVETDVDWKWRRFSYDYSGVLYAGMPAALLGGIVPVAAPLTLYGIGRSRKDLNLQTVGVAVAQASIVSTVLTTGIKAFTSRSAPDLWGDDKRGNEENFSDDFKFGFLKRVPFDGWPSGHTSAAWAMAATITEFYPNNIPLAIGLYGYATYIGLGVSTTIHWLSDGFAGALFGYAVGKTVARHFINKKGSPYSLVVLPNGITVVRNF